MKCQSCGHEVAANSRFCSHCGAKTSNENVCASCNAPLKPNAQFCSQCGAPAGAAAASLAAPAPATASRNSPLLILLPLLGTVVLIGILFLLFYNPANPKPGEANGMSQSQPQTMPQANGGGDPSDMSSMAPIFQQIDSLKNAVQANPKDVGALTHLGALFDMAGKFEQAAGYYKDILAVEPGNVEARMNYAGALFNNNERDKALAELHNVLKYRPDYDYAMYNLGVIYAAVHEHDKAKEWWDKVIALDANSDLAQRARQSLEAMAKE